MASDNEFLQLPNPDNIPGAVSSGYQAQNNNILTLQTGLDTCEPYDDGANVIIPVGGVVELNGVMFKIGRQVVLPKPNANSMYWIAVTDNEITSTDDNGKPVRTASAELWPRAGEWKPGKQGCYLPDGRRTLNRFIQPKDGYVITPNGNAFWERLTPGSDSAYLKKGWYLVVLKSGKGGADGGTSAGGVASQGTQKTISRFVFINENKFYDVYVGKGGANGVGGNVSAQSGGGGSGGGEATVFDTLDTGFVLGGKGGDGLTAGGAPGNNGRSGTVNQGGMGSGFLGGGGGGAGADNFTNAFGGNGGVLSDTLNPGLCQIYKWFD